jgi:probable phosphoglycerate mutase
VNKPTIILLRHGQTKWNVEGRYQGQLNSNLTALGKVQAKESALKISKFLNLEESFSFFSSPLGRAKETTEIICKTLNINKEKIVFDINLQEVNYGIFEGQTKIFCKTEYKKEFDAREASKWDYVLEGGGESYEMVTKRLNVWLQSIENEKIVVIVAHEMINRALRGIYCSYDTKTMLSLRQPNDRVIKLEKNQEFIIG